MVAVTDGSGAAVHLEVWEMPIEQFGHFMLLVPPPLGIGTVKLEDGSAVKGFICEGWVAGRVLCVWGGCGVGGWWWWWGAPDNECREMRAAPPTLLGLLLLLLPPPQVPARRAPPTSRTSRTSAPGSSMSPASSSSSS